MTTKNEKKNLKKEKKLKKNHKNVGVEKEVEFFFSNT
jgi:hypothetical protein